MNITTRGNVLLVSELTELNATNAGAFRDQLRAVMAPEHTQIDLDFTHTRFLDSTGLGALISIHKTLCARQGVVRIVNPSPQVQQILELTRMHRIFEIVTL